MKILVTSAYGVNGDGYGSILTFSLEGKRIGTFGAERGITRSAWASR